MRKLVLSTIAAVALLAPNAGALAQNGGGGGMKGSGDSGGEQPFGGNPFREDETRQQLPPEGASDYQVGLQMLQQHRYPEAISHLEPALEKKPNDAKILFYLGYAHHILGQRATGAMRDSEFKTSLDFYRRSLALDSENKGAHQYLGTLELQMHDQVAAAGELKALELLCPSGCDERDTLAKAVASYQAAQNAMRSPSAPRN